MVYVVRYKQTYVKTIAVEANDDVQARARADSLFKSGVVTLTSDNIVEKNVQTEKFNRARGTYVDDIYTEDDFAKGD